MSLSSAVCLKFFAGEESFHLPCTSSMTGAAIQVVFILNSGKSILRGTDNTVMHMFRNNIDWCVLNRVVFGEQQVTTFGFVLRKPFSQWFCNKQASTSFTGGKATLQ